MGIGEVFKFLKNLGLHICEEVTWKIQGYLGHGLELFLKISYGGMWGQSIPR